MHCFCIYGAFANGFEINMTNLYKLSFWNVLKIFSPLLLHIFEEKLGQCKVKRTKGQKTKISKDLKNGT